MDILMRGLAIFFGLFFGMLVWSRAVRSAHSLWLIITARRSGALPTAPSWVGLLLTLLSGLGLLAAAGVFSFYILSGPHRPEWNWFFGGALSTPLVIAINVVVFLRHKRVQQASRD